MTLDEQRAEHQEFLEDSYENKDGLQRIFDVQEVIFEPKSKTGFLERREFGGGKVGYILQQTRAVVTLIFSETETATYFRKNILEKKPHDFERIQQKDTQLEFDLTKNLVGRIFDECAPPFDKIDPIHWGLIEKYGGRETLINYLWKIAKSDILDTTAIVRT